MPVPIGADCRSGLPERTAGTDQRIGPAVCCCIAWGAVAHTPNKDRRNRFEPRPTMIRPPPAFPTALGTPRAAPPRDAIVCFSHLRWNLVLQRPQHLMTRAARTYDVVFFEDPVFDAIRSPRLDIRR